MGAFMDATCKCGRRFGWTGKATDRPPCPACGYRPPQAELESDEAEMKRFETFLLERKKQREAKTQSKRGPVNEPPERKPQ